MVVVVDRVLVVCSLVLELGQQLALLQLDQLLQLARQ